MSDTVSEKKSKSDGLTRTVESIFKTIFIILKSSFDGLKVIPYKNPVLWVWFGVYLNTLYLMCNNKWEIKLLNIIFPQIFQFRPFQKLYETNPNIHFVLISFSLSIFALSIFGLIKTFRKKKIENAFRLIGLLDDKGNGGRVVKIERIDEYRDKILVRTNTIDLEKFQLSRSKLEATIGTKISKIEGTKSPQLLFVHTNSGPETLEEKFSRCFRLIGLADEKGYGAAVESIEKTNDRMSIITVKSNGIGIDKYEERKDDLEAALGEDIIQFEKAAQPNIIKVFTGYLPNLVKIEDYKNTTVADGQTIIGRSYEKDIVHDFNYSPHMLVTGTTGGGKSVFVKGQILQLLEQQNANYQLYLIDFKRGVELQSFKSLPNVTLVRDPNSTIDLLRKLKVEMEKRFDYFYKHGFEKFTQLNGKVFDRVFIVVDEMAHLFQPDDNGKKDTAQTARYLLHQFTNQARAAGIHFILATQYAQKDIIDGHIKQNVEAKMTFKCNSMEASLVALGKVLAFKIPNIKGRAIWTTGGDKYYPVQSPLTERNYIEKRCKEIQKEFDEGKRKIFQEKIYLSSSELSKKQTMVPELEK